MKLQEIFDTLSPPSNSSDKTFEAIVISENANFRIGKNHNCNPVLLISTSDYYNNLILQNFQFKYIRLEYNVHCNIYENDNNYFQIFTIITFTHKDKNLQKYFFQISEILVKSLSNKPTQSEIVESLLKFIEIFRLLSDTPKKTVYGLWSELFLIDYSKDSKTLLNFWHNNPEDKFDFNSGSEKIEVKSNSNFERTHNFSYEQLNSSYGTSALIASIFIGQKDNGIGIQELVDRIIKKIKNDDYLVEKLTAMIINTLGNTFEESLKIKYDYELAIDSLRFYKQEDIPRIEKKHIPHNVFDVHYKSDLSEINPIENNSLRNPGALFRSIFIK